MFAETRISRRGLLGAAIGIAMAPIEHAMQESGNEVHSISALMEGKGMVRIPAGEFTMGYDQGNEDEQPAHRVKITAPFEIGKYEVTQAQWETVMTEAHPRPGVQLMNAQGAAVSAKPSHFNGPNYPVDSVSWDDIEFFLTRLNARDTKYSYRLPTEAEWEYACTGGKREAAGSLSDSAWFKDNSSETTQPVGQKRPNAFGLYDIVGNVAEWVQDWYSHDYYDGSPLADPQGPRTGSYRVYRGASWLDEAKYCRASHRGFDFPVSRFYNVGFRVVRSPK